jgi:hypothetical protein
MRRKKFFFIFLILLATLVAAYFSFQTASACFDFYTFKQSAPAQMTKWEIQEVRGKFPIKAHYFFEYHGNIWHGQTRFAKPWHLNELAALSVLEKMAKQNWVVWFHPNDPQKSSLEKIFPTGLFFRTLLCYGVVVYFLFIRFLN